MSRDSKKTLKPLGSFMPTRGDARLEKYRPGVQEMFGLNKRARRLKRGEVVTKPNGEIIR